MSIHRFFPYVLLLALLAVVFQRGFFWHSNVVSDVACSSSSSTKVLVANPKDDSNNDSQLHIHNTTTLTPSLAVPRITTPESCQRSLEYPGQLPNYFVCPPELQQPPSCQEIERHLYFVHSKSGSTTTDRIVSRHCSQHGERVGPKTVFASLRNVPKSLRREEKTVLLQAEGVAAYRHFGEKFSNIGNCYASMFMMRDPWTRYQSSYAYRKHNEKGRNDLYVHNDESMESFFRRYPNFVTAILGDPALHEHCTRYAKSRDYAFACWFQDVRYRGPEILQYLLDNLRRHYTTVGLTEEYATSMVLFQHAVGKDNKGAFCNQTGLLEMATFRRANAHKHKELTRNSIQYEQYRQYFWLDEILYEAVTALYQEQLIKARQIPELAEQLDRLSEELR